MSLRSSRGLSSMEERNLICVTCPVGCNLTVLLDGDRIVEVRGAGCRRGEEFVRKELTDPRRMLASTVRVAGGQYPLVPVRTVEPLPKALLLPTAQLLREIVLRAPVAEHQVVLKDALGSGVSIVTSRSMPACEDQDQG
jgi:CxxC motif-containing protein